MPFGPVPAQLDLVTLETQALQRWRESSLALRVTEARAGGEPWIFYEGPPTANGRPGLHHVWARVFKDLFPRYQTMRGRSVPRQGGWDCHGLPVEIEVERELGLSSKAEIESFGIDRFNARCAASVRRYVGDWEALTERSGVWIDTADAYWTLSNEYVESVWWLLEQLYQRGLLYEGHRVVPYCYRCGTALSSHELGQPGAYKDVTDRSVFVRFPLQNSEADLLVWTTTPWTLLSNVAVAVGADLIYARVRRPQQRDVIMARDLVDLEDNVVEEFKGSSMVGWLYRRPLDVIALSDDARPVIAAPFVTTTEGTGLVHIAPAFGADDMEVAKAGGLEVPNPVGPDGRFTAAAGQFFGLLVKEADGAVIEELKVLGLLDREQPYLHSYPHCWRCSTSLIYWAKTSWFVATSQWREKLLAENEAIDWHPDHIRHGRFGDWLTNNVDWALSRDRYWGTPLPIWRCPEGHDTCIGSVAQLASLTGGDLTSTDLHRPYVDAITFSCPTTRDGSPCGRPATRVAPVLDAWFDSGSMPSAQNHHPFALDSTWVTQASASAGEFTFAEPPLRFPADFICEAIDQTRGWFYSLLAVNTLVFGSSPYRSVVCLGLLVDEAGQKMSKSKGNVIDPWDIFNTFGADALRWYFFSSGAPWSNRRISVDAIAEATRTLVTMWNVFAGFFVPYADIDGWQPSPDRSAVPETDRPTHVLDRWILCRLDDAVSEVAAALDEFDAAAGAAALTGFIDSLSNWYVRRSRPRFWGQDAPFATLHQCLTTGAQLLAPFCPFLADEMYRVLTGQESVHLSDWPRAPNHETLGHANLRQEMQAAIRLVGLGRQAREQSRVATRQPLRRALLLHPGIELSAEVLAEIADELNVKQLDALSDLADVLTWKAVANFRALGPRLGPQVALVSQALAQADGTELRRTLAADGFVIVAGHRLGPGEVELRAVHHERFALVQDGGWAVALDLELDLELQNEGRARQLARALNELRKQQGFDLVDRISVIIEAGPQLKASVEAHRPWIAQQVLATGIVLSEPAEAGDSLGPPATAPATEIEIDGEISQLTISLAST